MPTAVPTWGPGRAPGPCALRLGASRAVGHTDQLAVDASTANARGEGPERV